MDLNVSKIFDICVTAIKNDKFIKRVSNTDKEFHFQNWFQDRLKESNLSFEVGGRNSYPDFRLVKTTEGYELKGLAYPGRDASFDSNSQVPTGFHNGRTIFYVFGRYPKNPDGNNYPVLDFVICHGDFLNADHKYIHKNKSIKGFGVYGDIMIRDRKMYVVPTPFRLAEGLAHHQTLILPSNIKLKNGYVSVGELRRKEASQVIVGYLFNLKTNEIVPNKLPNPNAGKEHVFQAWRLKSTPLTKVSLRPIEEVVAEASLSEEENDE